MKYTAFIFARGGSKGIPNKNIYPIQGKPLLAYSIESALKSKSISRVVVSTDSAEIAKIAEKFGAEILMRPADLASDASPEILSWRHAIDSFPQIFPAGNSQPFISLPATSPLRATEDIDAAVDKFKTTACDIVFGITPSHRNPYLNMVTIDENDLIKIAIKGSTAMRRQDVPDMYDVTTCVYVADASYVKKTEKLIDGRVGYVVIPSERALDIDSHFDMHLAGLLISNPFKGDK